MTSRNTGPPGPTTNLTEADELGARIARARERQQRSVGAPHQQRAALTLTATAWRMLADLLAGILVGFGLGWGLDQWLDTAPWFLIVMGLLGVAGGIRLAMRSVREMERHTPKDGTTNRDQ